MNRPAKAPPPQYDVGMNQPQYDDPPIDMNETREALDFGPPAMRNTPPLTYQGGGPDKPQLNNPLQPMTGCQALTAAIASVMAEIKPVEKSGFNKFHEYHYARMQDLIGELSPLMGKHGIVVFQNEVKQSMFDDNRVVAVQYQFTVTHKSGEIWPERPIMTGMSRCRDNKGGFDDKSFNKCHTSARKYFLISLFQIPTEDESDDADAHDTRGPPPRRAPAPDGTVAPYEIPTHKGQSADEWADDYLVTIAKTTTPDQINAWYLANKRIFERLKEGYAPVYERLTKALQARIGACSPPPPQQDAISSGPEPEKRAKAPPPPLRPQAPNKVMTAWLEEIDNIFSGHEDLGSLQEAHAKYMLPKRNVVPKDEWVAAVAIFREHVERVQDPK